MKKIVSIVGARPQFIKASRVCRQLRDNGFREVLVHTGQHYDLNMSDIFFAELGIPQPDYHLGVGSASHGKQTGDMLSSIEQILLREKPDLVLVYGDTNSTLAGSLAASKIHVPVAHVEAGLRSYNKSMPEEVNRVVTDHVSDILFCPTEISINNLVKEGFDNPVNGGKLIDRDDPAVGPGSAMPLVANVGDVMYDIAVSMCEMVNPGSVLERFGLAKNKYILVTIHRAENTDNPDNLRIIWEALGEIARAGINVFFPLHPRTRKAFMENSIPLDTETNIQCAEPVSYSEMLVLESNASGIITDSGGVQKEGFFFRVPCIIPRNETEWVELVESGWNILTGIDREKIAGTAIGLARGTGPGDWHPYYGDGHAVDRIVTILKGLD